MVVVAVVASVLVVGARDTAEAQVTRILHSSDPDLADGFSVPAGETWEFDPTTSTTITVTGNVVVQGRLVMRPDSASVNHNLIFAEIDESEFEGGGGTTPTAFEFPDDIGLWVLGDGALDIQGTPVVPWARTWQAGWAGDEVRAAPHFHGQWKSFKLIGNAAEVPATNGQGYNTELLNLTRNVVIRGTTSGYAHILIRSTAPQTIKYATIRYMGPQVPGFQDEGTDVTGRYPLHFHHSSGSHGSVVEGVVVRNSGNRAFVPHGSNGVTFTNTIAYSVVGPAYWWDPPSPSSPGLHESDDIVYNGAVAAKIWASDFQVHRSAAFELGAGLNPTVINSVAVGMQGGGKDNSGFFWPSKAEGVWTFVNNRAHNNNGHGAFVWQNGHVRHVINGFDAYNNTKAGVRHGAYNNAYLWQNVKVRGNGVPITSIAMGHDSDAGWTQVWKSIDTNGRLFIGSHISNDTSHPVRWMFCDFTKVVFEEGGLKGGVDFVNCGLKFADFNRKDIHPKTVVRVQNGDYAYKFTGNGPKKVIDKFWDGSVVPPPPAPTRRWRHRPSGATRPSPPPIDRTRSTGMLTVDAGRRDVGGPGVLRPGLTDPGRSGVLSRARRPLPGGVQPGDQLVDVVLVGVHVERGAGRRGELQVRHQRLGAVVARPDRHPVLLVDDGGDVVGVDVAEREADRPAPLVDVVWPVDHQVGHLGQPFEGVPGDRHLVGAHRRHPHLLEVVDGGTEPHRLGDGRGSRLELVGHRCPAASRTARRRRSSRRHPRAGSSPPAGRHVPTGSRYRSGRASCGRSRRGSRLRGRSRRPGGGAPPGHRRPPPPPPRRGRRRPARPPAAWSR